MEKRGKARSSIDVAAATLRDIALASPDGGLIGSEDGIVETLKVSRVTVRQAARLLEREGVLSVRRGINGGYFASRPSVEMVETVVCAYLDTLGLDARHTGGVATALWMETLREAACADRQAARDLVQQLAHELEQLTVGTIEAVGKFEQESRAKIFGLIEGTYIEVFFRINSAFSRQQVEAQFAGGDVVRPKLTNFFARWKKAKLMEFEAIAEGDEMLAMMTALHTRKVWLSRAKGDD